MRTVNIRASDVTAAEPVWGSVFLSLFLVAMLFCMLNVFIVMALYAYQDAKAAVSIEDISNQLTISRFVYYKLQHWLNRIRQLNYDTMGSEANQYNALESIDFDVSLMRVNWW